MTQLGYKNVDLDKPFGGGYIIRWLNRKYPHIFIFSSEINKKLYMTRNRKKIIKSKVEKLAKDITQIFDIELEAEEF